MMKTPISGAGEAMPMTRLSQIARHPAVAAFLARSEGDTGGAYAIATRPKPVLAGGEAVLA